jgi:hypothetical protein
MSYPFDPFAEIAQLQRTECRNGLSYKDLAQTACSVFTAAIGHPTYVLQEADLPPWEAVASKTASIIDLPDSEQAEVTLSAKALAKALYNQFALERDKNPDWDNEPNKIAWEAVGRHLANLIDSTEQSPDIEVLEQRIVAWARERSEPKTLVLS